MAEPPQHSSTSPWQYAALGVAVVAALAVGAFFVLEGDDDNDRPAFGGTPVSSLPGAPTAVPNTGVLQPNRPKEGEVAPDFALIDVRDGTTVRKLSDYRGRAVVLNWYASWCDPCKNEIPEFQKAQHSLGDSVVILGIDYLEDRDKALGILDRLGAKYPALLDSNAAVADHYRVGRGLPVTFFLDRDGVLRAMKTGEIRKDELPGFFGKVGLTYSPR